MSVLLFLEDDAWELGKMRKISVFDEQMSPPFKKNDKQTKKCSSALIRGLYQNHKGIAKT